MINTLGPVNTRGPYQNLNRNCNCASRPKIGRAISKPLTTPDVNVQRVMLWQRSRIADVRISQADIAIGGKDSHVARASQHVMGGREPELQLRMALKQIARVVKRSATAWGSGEVACVDRMLPITPHTEAQVWKWTPATDAAAETTNKHVAAAANHAVRFMNESLGG